MDTVELAEHARSGIAYCAQVTGRREQKNFLTTGVVSVDIDGGMALDEALDHPLVRDHAGFVYTTASHTDEDHRFRIVFPLVHQIDDALEVRALQRSLAVRLGGDLAATDPVRISFGNRNAEVFWLGHALSPELVRELIEQGRNDETASRREKVSTSRSSLLLNVADPIRTSTGAIVPFGELPHRTVVHCPYHHDKNPSAFVVESRDGVRGLHCSKCSTSYWPNRLLEVVDDFEAAARTSLRERGHGLRAFDAVTVDFDEDFPAPGRLTTRLTLVRSPKGSGKTTALANYFGRKDKVLLVGHRRLLNLQSSARLGLQAEGRKACRGHKTAAAQSANPCCDA
jgi:hypothetical protein